MNRVLQYLWSASKLRLQSSHVFRNSLRSLTPRQRIHNDMSLTAKKGAEAYKLIQDGLEAYELPLMDLYRYEL